MGESSDLTGEQQYEALRTDAGFVRLGHRTQIELTGADRASLLHNLCTNDVTSLTPGWGCEAFVTDVRGKVLGHVLVFAGEDNLVIDTVEGQAADLLPHFDKYILRENVQLTDQSDRWCELLLAGPQAMQIWGEVGSRPAPDALYSHTVDEFAGQPLAVRRVPMTSSPTLLISGDPSAMTTLADSLCKAGAADCWPTVYEQVRIESGWPEFGRDISRQNLPQEVNRDRQAIHFEKGCYLGQETVARIDALGHVNQKLAGLKFSSSDVPAEGTKLVHNDKTVGRVTSAVYSPRLQAALALGYVRREHNAVGTQLDCAAGTAEVVQLPLAGD